MMHDFSIGPHVSFFFFVCVRDFIISRYSASRDATLVRCNNNEISLGGKRNILI